MTWILNAAEVTPTDRHRFGGKGFALAQLAGNGFTIPATLCLAVDAYDQFVSRTGLRERILLELHRKDFKEMRWEEIWDCAARIRNMFLRTPMPIEVEERLRREAALGKVGKRREELERGRQAHVRPPDVRDHGEIGRTCHRDDLLHLA